MAIDFEGIRITGVDRAKTYNTRPEDGLEQIYFTLSARPAAKWIDIFAALLGADYAFTNVRPNLGNGLIQLKCNLEPKTVQEYLDRLKQFVTETNQKYAEYLQEQNTLEEERKQRLDKTINKLKFD